MKETLVIALGGNALGNTPEEQLSLVKGTAKTIVNLVEQGYNVVVGHGNGPQVGVINQGLDYAANSPEKTPHFDFPECGAMSQGYIGYHLQQAIGEELSIRNINKVVSSIVTQVVVDEADPAFSNLSKPVGSFYSKEESEKIAKEKGYTFVEDAGRGYRRVVASPNPIKILELPVILQLIKGDMIPIAVGGGGIPVVPTKHGYKGVPAVIDKDKSCATLASNLGADKLIILTAVDQVFINYNTPQQKAIEKMTIADCEQYIAQGHFAKGSMLPKIEACMSYIQQNPNGTALITSLEKASDALKGNTGTIIVK